MRRVYLIIVVFFLVSSILFGTGYSSRLTQPGSLRITGGFSDFGLRIGILSFLEAGWFMNEGPYFALGYDSNFHIASRVSFSSLEQAKVTAEFGYDFKLVYLEVGALYEYNSPGASFLGGHLKSEFFFDNSFSIVSASLGRFQKVAGEIGRMSFTSVGFSARRKFDIGKEFYFLNLESVEVVGSLKWEIEDDLTKFNPFPAYSFVGVQVNISILK